MVTNYEVILFGGKEFYYNRPEAYMRSSYQVDSKYCILGTSDNPLKGDGNDSSNKVRALYLLNQYFYEN